MTTTAKQLTVGDVARRYGIALWRVRRAADALGVDLPRVGAYRVIPALLLPAIEAELARRGWLPDGGKQ